MPIRRTYTTSPELRAIQDAIDAELLRFEIVPFLRGCVVELPAQGAGPVMVAHGMGRKAQGWIVLRLQRGPTDTSGISIFQRAGERNDDMRLALYSSTTFQRLVLWVF
jgi:hypothetical protein